jgi:hypothetical protein
MLDRAGDEVARATTIVRYDPKSTFPAHVHRGESVRIENWEPGATVAIDAAAGAELFVLAGTFEERGKTFRRYSWPRLPPSAPATATAGQDGTRIWVKSGHLRFARRPKSR